MEPHAFLYKMCDNQNYGVNAYEVFYWYFLLIPSVLPSSSRSFSKLEQDVKAIEVSLLLV